MDIDRVLEAALERGCYLEINAQPDRLDLNDVNCKKAKEMGMKLAISTDSHRPSSLRSWRCAQYSKLERTQGIAEKTMICARKIKRKVQVSRERIKSKCQEKG